jgi:hypothetical protein
MHAWSIVQHRLSPALNYHFFSRRIEEEQSYLQVL